MHDQRSGGRFGTFVRDGAVYVEAPDGEVPVGPLDRIVELVGGPAWTVEYSDWHCRRYPDLDTGDEGLVIDVGDAVRALTHDRDFVAELRALPAERTPGRDAVAPRVGLFVGRLLGDLQSGVS